jgi:phospholipase C
MTRRDPVGWQEFPEREAAARFEAEHEEEALRRRDFLGRTAALAGLTALGSVLPVDTLVAQAARNQVAPLPAPRDLPIDTIVVLMMENRSFDHYFGWVPGSDAKNAGLQYPDAGGRLLPTHRLTPDFQGCAFRDPDHTWYGGRWQLNRGRCDGFVTGNAAGTGSDEYAIGYYLAEDIPLYAGVTTEATVFDRFFCSIMASTQVNRHYMWSANAGGHKSNRLPIPEVGYRWETIFDRALRRGVGARYFASDIPVSALYGPRAIPWTGFVSEYYERAAAGTLPNIVYVDPAFRDGSGGNGVSADDHPHGDIRLGQAFASDVVHAFIESPHWSRGALFLVYDEWGGFFDHVRPPRVPDARASADPLEDWGQLGFRIPAMVISPYARRGYVSHLFTAFEAILKLISYRFGLGYLTKRHRFASNIGRALDFVNPRFDPPALPRPAAIAAAECPSGGAQPRARQNVSRPKDHDLVELETSGYLERAGFSVRPATYGSVFRDPDTIRRALSG